MIKQIFYYFVFTIILNVTSQSRADTLFQWDFDGSEGGVLISALDTVSDANLVEFSTSGFTNQIFYSKTNPWFNTSGTSVEFLNDRVYKEVGSALAVVDTGKNTDLDLSMNEAFTIEFFLYQSGLNNCVLVGKGDSFSGYFIKLFYDGTISFSINTNTNVILTGSYAVQRGKWYHIAAVFDKTDSDEPMKLFIDGILSASGGNNTQVIGSTNSFSIGTYVDNSYEPPRSSGSFKFSGRLDELRISDVALSPDDFLLNTVKTKALYPYPENQAEQFSRTTHLTWQPAKGVSKQRIYFGLNPDNLDLVAEVGPEINTLSNKHLGGKLLEGETYYWRVDSQSDTNQNINYDYEGEGKGQTWSFTTQDNIIHDGYIKWLLHLGQSPNDMVLSGGNSQLQPFGGDPNIRPTVGEIYDFSANEGNFWSCHTSHDLMIWTPQYSSTGSFDGYGFENFGVQYYHIYIYSPKANKVRLHISHFERITVWCNGNIVMNLAGSQENICDFILQEGYNSILFKVGVEISYGRGYDSQWYYLAANFTDCNDLPLTDLTYSLESPLPERDIYVNRILPLEYDPNQNIEVTLKIDAKQELEQSESSIIELIPDGSQVVDSGGGYVTGNSIHWLYPVNDDDPEEIRYTLSVPNEQVKPIPFLGYIYLNKQFEEITGDKILFNEPQISPEDMTETMDTIEIDSTNFITSNDMNVEESRFWLSGLGISPSSITGWAEYEFDVKYPGTYQIVIDYGEYWTMFNGTANLILIFDQEHVLDTKLYPSTHYFEGSTYDPERKGLCLAGSLELEPGEHNLYLYIDQVKEFNYDSDAFTNLEPMIRKITLTNYPNLNIPRFAEPHHLDSYEHAPARIVHSRDITTLPDGRIEITYYGTFYSLSQGNEIYFADRKNLPKPGTETSLFEIVSFEPDVFHLPPNGEQDFTLTVRSKKQVIPDYAELFVLWLQGTPNNSTRKPYLFSTAQQYIQLPEWEHSESFWMVDWLAWFIRRDILDPPDAFFPTAENIGFNNGRYTLSPVEYFKEQLKDGKLSSVADIFNDNNWPYDETPPVHNNSWNVVWASLIGSLYSREGTALQAKDYALYLANNMVFYPIQKRWDWAQPGYLPNMLFTTDGFPALLLAIRAARERLLNDDEQFYLIHNLVLPIFNSYWEELRVVLFLDKDANEGDKVLHLSRPLYGITGYSTEGIDAFYIKIDGDAYLIKNIDIDTIMLNEPLHKDYPKGTEIVSWPCREEHELEAMDLMSLIAFGEASRDPALIDQIMSMYSEDLEKQEVFLYDGSFRNEPGSYGSINSYAQTLLDAKQLFGKEVSSLVSPDVSNKIHNAIINISMFPFSNGKYPHLNGGGAMNQYDRSYYKEIYMLDDLFPEDTENIELYQHIGQQELNRQPGDIIDNHNFVVNGWGYAMLRSENGSWDRGMETLLSSKYLQSNPGDHVSHDCLGIVIYGLGAILTPRYGYSWMGYAPPFLNQVMIDSSPWENDYYGSFWHFDGRKELPCAVAHTGDGDNCSNLDYEMSRWCIQFPEYLFDAYFVRAKDLDIHQYEWNFINMGDLSIEEPENLYWSDYPEFLDGYWPELGDRGAGTRMISSSTNGRIIADWNISNEPWVANGDPKLLRNEPEHSGCLRLIMSDNGTSKLIDAQVGYYSQWNGEQTLANSQDILALQKHATSHAFIDTLETIAEDEEAYVINVEVIEQGAHNQQLVKVTTSEGQDWIYLSGKWNFRQDGENPITSISTNADIVAWRIVNNIVKRVYIANGSYADTAYGLWNFGTVGNHYIEY